MLISGIIAVFKAISLKTGDGELHRPCLLQFFCLLKFPLPPVISETPGVVVVGGGKLGKMLERSGVFYKKKKGEEKWNALNLTESSVCILQFQIFVTSFNCALRKTQQAESHCVTLIFCLKLQKWRWMKILWRSASYFDQKLVCEIGLESSWQTSLFSSRRVAGQCGVGNELQRHGETLASLKYRVFALKCCH